MCQVFFGLQSEKTEKYQSFGIGILKIHKEKALAFLRFCSFVVLWLCIKRSLDFGVLTIKLRLFKNGEESIG